MIITLCGSTSFKKEYEELGRKLALNGHIVLSCAVFGHADDITLSKVEKELLDKVHLQKIDMSEIIWVVNKDGYIGDSTKSEIEYAKKTGKRVYYLEPYYEDTNYTGGLE